MSSRRDMRELVIFAHLRTLMSMHAQHVLKPTLQRCASIKRTKADLHISKCMIHTSCTVNCPRVSRRVVTFNDVYIKCSNSSKHRAVQS